MHQQQPYRIMRVLQQITTSQSHSANSHIPVSFSKLPHPRFLQQTASSQIPSANLLCPRFLQQFALSQIPSANCFVPDSFSKLFHPKFLQPIASSQFPSANYTIPDSFKYQTGFHCCLFFITNHDD